MSWPRGIIPDLVELKDQTTASLHVVLSALNRCGVIGRRAGIEIADLGAKACEAIARKNNSAVVVVVIDPYGLVVHEHRMDGEGWIQINATEQKARTALRRRSSQHR
jgi:hypothetical protein